MKHMKGKEHFLRTKETDPLKLTRVRAESIDVLVKSVMNAMQQVLIKV